MSNSPSRLASVSNPSATLATGREAEERHGVVDRFTLIAAILFTAFAVLIATGSVLMPDFFIFRLGSLLTARGENPYDVAKVRSYIATQFPEENPKPESFINNCGYFLPPQATVLFLPFAMLPWTAAKLAWALLQGLAGLAIATVPKLLRRKNDPPLAGLVPKLLPFLLLLNFLAIGVVLKGQSTVLAVGCVVAGLWCFASSERWMILAGCLLWSVPFIKPHVALPLIPLAWYLYGWKRAASVVLVVIMLNVLGAILIGGSPVFLRDYLNYLSVNHHAVMFNRVELNPEIASWNRLLFVATEPFAGHRFLIEQTATTILASYFVWFGLLLGRCASLGEKPSASWALAAAVAGAVWCPQVLGYEVFFLVLAVPWIRELFIRGYRTWGFAAVMVLVLQAFPFQALEPIGLTFHRPLGVALFAILVLVGPSGDRFVTRLPGE